MTRPDAVATIRKMAETLIAQPVIRVPDRTRMAQALESAAEILGAEVVGGIEISWDDVDHLRAEARKARGLPGLQFRTHWIASLADRLEAALPPRGM